jgi:hypothetical protein
MSTIQCPNDTDNPAGGTGPTPNDEAADRSRSSAGSTLGDVTLGATYHYGQYWWKQILPLLSDDDRKEIELKMFSAKDWDRPHPGQDMSIRCQYCGAEFDLQHGDHSIVPPPVHCGHLRCIPCCNCMNFAVIWFLARKFRPVAPTPRTWQI